MRLGGVDVARHAFAIAVIWLHMRSDSRYPPEVNVFIAQVGQWLDGAVMGFFIISGLFFRPPSSLVKSEIWYFLKRWCHRLIVPYATFSIIYVLVMHSLGKQDLTSGLIKVAILHGGSMQLYFLPSLFLIALVVYAASGVATRHLGSDAFASWVIAVTGGLSLLLPTAGSTGSNPKLLPLYAMCFGVGIGTASAMHHSRVHLVSRTALILTLFGIASFLDHRFGDAFLAYAIVLLGLWASHLIPSLQRSFSGSGGVYLLHTPIVNFGVSTVLISIGVTAYLNLFFSLAGTYLICLLITLATIRFFPRARQVLLE